MKVRVLTSIGIAVFGLPVLFLSEYLIYPMVVALLSLAAMYEMTALTGFRNRPVIWVPSYLLALLMPIGAYFVNADNFSYLTTCAGVLFAFLLYFYGYAIFKKGEVKFAELSMHFTTLVYISISFTALSLVRYITNGVYMFALVFVGSWVCDMFAYFVGRAIGKHKLIEVDGKLGLANLHQRFALRGGASRQ